MELMSQSCGSPPGPVCAPEDTWQCLETFSIFITLGVRVLLAPSVWKAGMSPKPLKYRMAPSRESSCPRSQQRHGGEALCQGGEALFQGRHSKQDK